MTTITKTILNANKQFSDTQVARINGAFSEAVRTTRTLLKGLPNVDVVFYDNPEYVVSETGIGGNTDNANTIFIPLDAGYDFSERELLFVIRHELHHTARMNELGQTDSLFKKVISEGLADQFEKEFEAGYQPITYRKDIPHKKIIEGIKELKDIIKTKDYNYYEWFFGYNERYPNWFGYTLGNYIIEAYCRKNYITPSELVITPAEEFESFIDTLI
jgi:uncharacterized protein YjaZ